MKKKKEEKKYWQNKIFDKSRKTVALMSNIRFIPRVLNRTFAKVKIERNHKHCLSRDGVISGRFTSCTLCLLSCTNRYSGSFREETDDHGAMTIYVESDPTFTPWLALTSGVWLVHIGHVPTYRLGNRRCDKHRVGCRYTHESIIHYCPSTVYVSTVVDSTNEIEC